MYDFIKGKLAELNPAYAVVEAGGIGYVINVSLNTFAALEGKSDVMVYLHQVVREDAHLLYGFATVSERELFRHLISVSGVGANTARVILSSLSADEIAQAIMQGDVNTLKQIKGIGLKTAQRIVIDLKDKLGKSALEQDIFASSNNTVKQEALSALVMLGFTKSLAEKSIEQLFKKNPSHTVESLIKDALKGL
ncbi:MAG: Holliday junction branch migration protein RuvA [Tenuifilaceae bacterium]|jgi:Holliday junction DNA helicase RuvA|uniref:Holliday junction branch migration protein RuvA n=1 Tax=Perlabentimonas gracilis TaxID=2715279 RepID=UPI00140C84EA|nr:Holliday junction branch migration protein RuvA [Perlabentimonas gracilis]MDX9770236.1 Holliday junction branch migration protein RuvA [Tenuifilaceae bacterium]NHB69951.1 Holliday junction branch migration protein RuvA [Perlabentimonas gracilis]